MGVVSQTCASLRAPSAESPARRDLNSWRRADGSWDDALETAALASLDAAGAGALRHVDEFVESARADEHLRLLNLPAIEHIALYAAIAGLMVRSPDMCERLDGHALPTLKRQVLANLARATAHGTADDDVAKVLRQALERPDGVELDPGENRHQALLVPLLRTVAASLGARLLVGVRRFSRDLSSPHLSRWSCVRRRRWTPAVRSPGC